MLKPEYSVICPNCQTENPKRTKFCGECGQNLGARVVAKIEEPLCHALPEKNHRAKAHDLSELRGDFIARDMAVDRIGRNGTCHTVAICNQKGGVGKTVTAINLSAMLATSGLRTLLVDLDPQGHSGLGLGLDVDALDRSVYDVLLNGTCPVREAIVPLRPNLEILPSNIDLASAELELARLAKRETRLREVIDGLRESYEYIVIDCPPSIGILTVNALAASELVIVPVTSSFYSIRGLSKIVEVSEALQDSLSLDVRIFSVVTFFKEQQRETRLQRENLEATPGHQILKTSVRKNTKLNEAIRKGLSIFEYAPDCIAGRDYSDLAREINFLGSNLQNTVTVNTCTWTATLEQSPIPG